MAFDTEYFEGFDKYGPTGFTDIATAILNEWTTMGAGGIAVVAALAGTGYALQLSGTSASEQQVTRGLGANYARMVGGYTFNADLGLTFGGLAFKDGATTQLNIGINNAGNIVVFRGGAAGTLLATSTEVVASGSVHCLEYDVTFHNTAGAVKVWLDGLPTSIALTGTDTSNTANNYANTLALSVRATAGVHTHIFDHLYLWNFLASGGAETPALTNPVIQTDVGTADSAVAFSKVAGVLGLAYRTTTATSAPTANSLVLRKYTPETSATLNSVSIVPGATSATAKLKPVVYADSSGAPGALLSTGAEVVGTTSGSTLTMPLTTPQSLVAGTQYWVGYITDTSFAMRESDTSALGYRAANTYTSGAPGTAPAMTSAQASFLIWGNCTGMANNFAQVNEPVALGLLSYNESSNVGDEDLFSFPALPSTPASIYGTAVKALVAKSDAGARTVDLRTKSASASSSGSNAGQAPATTFGFLASYFDTDPNTAAPWSAAALATSKHGLKVAS